MLLLGCLGIFDLFAQNYFYQEGICIQKFIPNLRGNFIQPNEQEWFPDCHKPDRKKYKYEHIHKYSDNEEY